MYTHSQVPTPTSEADKTFHVAFVRESDEKKMLKTLYLKQKKIDRNCNFLRLRIVIGLQC